MKMANFSIYSEPRPEHLGQHLYPETFPDNPIEVSLNIGGEIYSDITNNISLLCLSLSIDSLFARSGALKHFIISMDCLFDVLCDRENNTIIIEGANQCVDIPFFCSTIDQFVGE